jgi:hypothetical protein
VLCLADASAVTVRHIRRAVRAVQHTEKEGRDNCIQKRVRKGFSRKMHVQRDRASARKRHMVDILKIQMFRVCGVTIGRLAVVGLKRGRKNRSDPDLRVLGIGPVCLGMAFHSLSLYFLCEEARKDCTECKG